ncbi:unnamed protein product [Rhodiola kirilowii]
MDTTISRRTKESGGDFTQILMFEDAAEDFRLEVAMRARVAEWTDEPCPAVSLCPTRQLAQKCRVRAT